MVNWLTRRAVRRVADELATVLCDTLCAIDTDGEMSETKFRDATMSVLRQVGYTDLKREAGVQGTGTRLDIYAHSADHDFLITIKKGLNEQKVKKAIGEINIVFDRWRPTVQGNATYIFLYVFGIKQQKELEALNAFIDFANRANKQHAGSFVVDFALAGSASENDD